jgi:hypothetical protein
MNFRSVAIIVLGLAPINFSIAFFQKPALAAPNGYCTHGNTWISEDIGRVKATVLLEGDFDGDGKIDYFCKDIRPADSNRNQALEWLILGNGTFPINAQTNNWCTHKNSRLAVVRKGGDRDQILCSDSNTSWLRSIPFGESVASAIAQNYPAGVKYLLANNDAITKAITTAWNAGGKGIAQQKISEAIGGKVFRKGVSLYGQNVNLGDIQSRGVEFNPNTNQIILKVSAPGSTEFKTTTPTVFGSYGDPSFRVGFNLNATITISTATNKVNIDDVVVEVGNGSFRGSNAVGTIVESVGDYFTNGRFSQGIISKINGNYSVKNQLVGLVKSSINQYVPANILNQ